MISFWKRNNQDPPNSLAAELCLQQHNNTPISFITVHRKPPQHSAPQPSAPRWKSLCRSLLPRSATHCTAQCGTSQQHITPQNAAMHDPAWFLRGCLRHRALQRASHRDVLFQMAYTQNQITPNFTTLQQTAPFRTTTPVQCGAGKGLPNTIVWCGPICCHVSSGAVFCRLAERNVAPGNVFQCTGWA